MASGLPSLRLIAARVDAQLELQIRHFESLDNKAGIVLGFAGVLAAVAGARAYSLWEVAPSLSLLLSSRSRHFYPATIP